MIIIFNVYKTAFFPLYSIFRVVCVAYMEYSMCAPKRKIFENNIIFGINIRVYITQTVLVWLIAWMKMKKVKHEEKNWAKEDEKNTTQRNYNRFKNRKPCWKARTKKKLLTHWVNVMIIIFRNICHGRKWLHCRKSKGKTRKIVLKRDRDRKREQHI